MATMAPVRRISREGSARFDERFDEVNRRITEGKEETNRRITEWKEESNHRFDRVEGDIRDLKKSVESIQATLTRVSIGVALTFASVLLTRGI